MAIGNSISKWQMRIFAACFIAYTAAYICRVNISVALPGIQEDLGLSSTSVGLIGTSFFWVYAIGQLVNGYVGDKVSSRIFIFIGLIVSAVLNIFFGLSTVLIIMIFLWSANGLFQSMLWGPTVKTLANWFPKGKNAIVAFRMSFSMIIGYLIAWGVSGIILDVLGWKWVFWIPAGIVLILACVWYVMVRNKPSDVGLPDVHEESHEVSEKAVDSCIRKEEKSMAFWKLISGTNLIFIAFTGITQGIIKESISLWGPKLLMDTVNLSLKSTMGAILIIPVLNFIGIMFAKWLNKLLKSKEKITIMLLMAGSSLTSLSLVLFGNVSTVLGIFLIACTSAFVFGANPAMTTIIPLSYKKHGRVSSVAGFIDFSIYLGSGLAGVFTGFIVDNSSWNSVFIMWCLVSLLGALSMGISILKELRSSNVSTLIK